MRTLSFVAPSPRPQHHNIRRVSSVHRLVRVFESTGTTASRTNLIIFVSDIATTSSYSNVKLHLAAIKFYATANGYRVEQFRRLYLTVRGIKKSQGARFHKPKRLPVTPNLLRTIKNNLFGSSLRFHDKCMLWSAMTMAFFGLLRASEYVHLQKHVVLR